jgi:prephenate dehydrogenase
MGLDIKMLYPKATVYGLTVMKIICREALTLGVIDEIINADADFVIVSVPDVALTVLPEVLDLIGENTIVFEVGSTKTLICGSSHKPSQKKEFIATHPIAGTEFSGPSAISGLFQGQILFVRWSEPLSNYRKKQDLLKPSG